MQANFQSCPSTSNHSKFKQPSLWNLFTLLTNGMCFCTNCVVTLILTPWNIVDPFAPKCMSLLTMSILVMPSNPTKLCTMMEVKLLKVAPSITFYKEYGDPLPFFNHTHVNRLPTLVVHCNGFITTYNKELIFLHNNLYGL